MLRRRLREIRLARRLTQEQLCDLAGISRDAISRIENGSRTPSIPTLERIIKALDISWSGLFDRDRESGTNQSPHLAKIIAMLENEPVERQRTAEAIVRAFLKFDGVKGHGGIRSEEAAMVAEESARYPDGSRKG